MLHLLGHLVSASNDHMTHFWARERTGDVPFVLPSGGTEPAAAGLDNNVDGKAEGEDDAPALCGFDNSTSIVGAGACEAW